MLSYAHERAKAEALPGLDWTTQEEPGHFVQFYESDAFLLDTLQRLVGSALRAGDSVLLLITAAHRADLEVRLRDQGLEVEAPAAAGRYLAVDAAETLSRLMVADVPDAGLFQSVIDPLVESAARAGGQVRAFGEMVALLWADGNQRAALQLENLWNDLRTRLAISLLCGYPLTAFEGESFSASLVDVCDAHSRVIPGESYTGLRTNDEQLRAIARLQQRATSLEREVAERKRRELELSRSIRVRDEFLAAISHDLRTPLTVLHGQAQVLKRRLAKGTLDEQSLQRSLEQIESRSQLMTSLVDELLDVTQLRAGADLQLFRRPVDLVSLIRDVASVRQMHTDQHRLFVAATEPEIIGVWDSVRVRRVLENLLDNAIKYSPRGGDISAGLSCEERAGEACAVLTVQDHGIGIPPDDLPHVFEWFYRGRNTGGGYVGTGLGLAGSRQVIEQHGGAITLHSVEGIGTTVTVRLPLNPVSGPAA